MTRSGIIQLIQFFLYLLFQVMILKHVVLFHMAFCFVYVAYLLMRPVETNPLTLMLIGFVMGFGVDIFYDSLGIHALASVFIMYVRTIWLSNLTPQGGYDAGARPTLGANGSQWFFIFVLPLVLIHHTILFFVEAGGFDHFWFTLVKVGASALFTTISIFIVEFAFPERKRI